MTLSNTIFLVIMFGPITAVMLLLYLRIFYLSFKTPIESVPWSGLSTDMSADVVSKLNTLDEQTSERWMCGE